MYFLSVSAPQWNSSCARYCRPPLLNLQKTERDDYRNACGLRKDLSPPFYSVVLRISAPSSHVLMNINIPNRLRCVDQNNRVADRLQPTEYLAAAALHSMNQWSLDMCCIADIAKRIEGGSGFPLIPNRGGCRPVLDECNVLYQRLPLSYSDPASVPIDSGRSFPLDNELLGCSTCGLMGAQMI